MSQVVVQHRMSPPSLVGPPVETHAFASLLIKDYKDLRECSLHCVSMSVCVCVCVCVHGGSLCSFYMHASVKSSCIETPFAHLLTTDYFSKATLNLSLKVFQRRLRVHFRDTNLLPTTDSGLLPVAGKALNVNKHDLLSVFWTVQLR